MTYVSIPFKRESGAKEYMRAYLFRDIKFQFPSNGKVEPKSLKRTRGDVYYCFNSLQTGKWSQRKLKVTAIAAIAAIVSIPFKRESGAKAKRKDKRERNFGFQFQFPSNGKVEPKGGCFGSHHWNNYSVGFNSLQTGKWSQRRQRRLKRIMVTHTVSIPFKRESGAKDETQ